MAPTVNSSAKSNGFGAARGYPTNNHYYALDRRLVNSILVDHESVANAKNMKPSNPRHYDPNMKKGEKGLGHNPPSPEPAGHTNKAPRFSMTQAEFEAAADALAQLDQLIGHNEGNGVEDHPLPPPKRGKEADMNAAKSPPRASPTLPSAAKALLTARFDSEIGLKILRHPSSNPRTQSMAKNTQSNNCANAIGGSDTEVIIAGGVKVLPALTKMRAFMETASPYVNFNSPTGSGKSMAVPVFYLARGVSSVLSTGESSILIMCQPKATPVQQTRDNISKVLSRAAFLTAAATNADLGSGSFERTSSIFSLVRHHRHVNSVRDAFYASSPSSQSLLDSSEPLTANTTTTTTTTTKQQRQQQAKIGCNRYGQPQLHFIACQPSAALDLFFALYRQGQLHRTRWLIDEVHERSADTDILLTYLARVRVAGRCDDDGNSQPPDGECVVATQRASYLPPLHKGCVMPSAEILTRSPAAIKEAIVTLMTATPDSDTRRLLLENPPPPTFVGDDGDFDIGDPSAPLVHEIRIEEKTLFPVTKDVALLSRNGLNRHLSSHCAAISAALICRMFASSSSSSTGGYVYEGTSVTLNNTNFEDSGALARLSGQNPSPGNILNFMAGYNECLSICSDVRSHFPSRNLILLPVDLSSSALTASQAATRKSEKNSCTPASTVFSGGIPTPIVAIDVKVTRDATEKSLRQLVADSLSRVIEDSILRFETDARFAKDRNTTAAPTASALFPSSIVAVLPLVIAGRAPQAMKDLALSPISFDFERDRHGLPLSTAAIDALGRLEAAGRMSFETFRCSVDNRREKTSAASSTAAPSLVPRSLNVKVVKVIAATNAVESSVTIHNLSAVVDSGFYKEGQYDPVRDLTTLELKSIPSASAVQRAGRCGRTKEGIVWRIAEQKHQTVSPSLLLAKGRKNGGKIPAAMLPNKSSFDNDTADEFLTSATPELLTADLGRRLLKLLKNGVDVASLLPFVPSPIPADRVTSTYNRLIRSGAIIAASTSATGGAFEITPVGRAVDIFSQSIPTTHAITILQLLGSRMDSKANTSSTPSAQSLRRSFIEFLFVLAVMAHGKQQGYVRECDSGTTTALDALLPIADFFCSESDIVTLAMVTIHAIASRHASSFHQKNAGASLVFFPQLQCPKSLEKESFMKVRQYIVDVIEAIADPANQDVINAAVGHSGTSKWFFSASSLSSETGEEGGDENGASEESFSSQLYMSVSEAFPKETARRSSECAAESRVTIRRSLLEKADTVLSLLFTIDPATEVNSTAIFSHASNILESPQITYAAARIHGFGQHQGQEGLPSSPPEVICFIRPLADFPRTYKYVYALGISRNETAKVNSTSLIHRIPDAKLPSLSSNNIAQQQNFEAILCAPLRERTFASELALHCILSNPLVSLDTLHTNLYRKKNAAAAFTSSTKSPLSFVSERPIRALPLISPILHDIDDDIGGYAFRQATSKDTPSTGTMQQPKYLSIVLDQLPSTRDKKKIGVRPHSLFVAEDSTANAVFQRHLDPSKPTIFSIALCCGCPYVIQVVSSSAAVVYNTVEKAQCAVPTPVITLPVVGGIPCSGARVQASGGSGGGGATTRCPDDGVLFCIPSPLLPDGKTLNPTYDESMDLLSATLGTKVTASNADATQCIGLAVVTSFHHSPSSQHRPTDSFSTNSFGFINPVGGVDVRFVRNYARTIDGRSSQLSTAGGVKSEDGSLEFSPFVCIFIPPCELEVVQTMNVQRLRKLLTPVTNAVGIPKLRGNDGLAVVSKTHLELSSSPSHPLSIGNLLAARAAVASAESSLSLPSNVHLDPYIFVEINISRCDRSVRPPRIEDCLLEHGGLQLHTQNVKIRAHDVGSCRFVMTKERSIKEGTAAVGFKIPNRINESTFSFLRSNPTAALSGILKRMPGAFCEEPELCLGFGADDDEFCDPFIFRIGAVARVSCNVSLSFNNFLATRNKKSSTVTNNNVSSSAATGNVFGDDEALVSAMPAMSDLYEYYRQVLLCNISVVDRKCKAIATSTMVNDLITFASKVLREVGSADQSLANNAPPLPPHTTHSVTIPIFSIKKAIRFRAAVNESFSSELQSSMQPIFFPSSSQLTWEEVTRHGSAMVSLEAKMKQCAANGKIPRSSVIELRETSSESHALTLPIVSDEVCIALLRPSYAVHGVGICISINKNQLQHVPPHSVIVEAAHRYGIPQDVKVEVDLNPKGPSVYTRWNGSTDSVAETWKAMALLASNELSSVVIRRADETAIPNVSLKLMDWRDAGKGRKFQFLTTRDLRDEMMKTFESHRVPAQAALYVQRVDVSSVSLSFSASLDGGALVAGAPNKATSDFVLKCAERIMQTRMGVTCNTFKSDGIPLSLLRFSPLSMGPRETLAALHSCANLEVSFCSGSGQSATACVLFRSEFSKKVIARAVANKVTEYANGHQRGVSGFVKAPEAAPKRFTSPYNYEKRSFSPSALEVTAGGFIHQAEKRCEALDFLETYISPLFGEDHFVKIMCSPHVANRSDFLRFIAFWRRSIVASSSADDGTNTYDELVSKSRRIVASFSVSFFERYRPGNYLIVNKDLVPDDASLEGLRSLLKVFGDRNARRREAEFGEDGDGEEDSDLWPIGCGMGDCRVKTSNAVSAALESGNAAVRGEGRGEATHGGALCLECTKELCESTVSDLVIPTPQAPQAGLKCRDKFYLSNLPDAPRFTVPKHLRLSFAADDGNGAHTNSEDASKHFGSIWWALFAEISSEQQQQQQQTSEKGNNSNQRGAFDDNKQGGEVLNAAATTASGNGSGAAMARDALIALTLWMTASSWGALTTDPTWLVCEAHLCAQKKEKIATNLEALPCGCFVCHDCDAHNSPHLLPPGVRICGEKCKKAEEAFARDPDMPKCPNCKHGVIRTDGCSKIPCKCGHFWCYQCVPSQCFSSRTEDTVYRHLREKHGDISGGDPPHVIRLRNKYPFL